MEPNQKQIKQAIRMPNSESYLRENYGITRSEARKIIKYYHIKKSRKLKRNLTILTGSAILGLGLFFGRHSIQDRYNKIVHNNPLVQTQQTEHRNPLEKSKRIEDAISPYSEIQFKLNPGQEKTLYVYGQTHMNARRNKKTGKAVGQTISESALHSQGDLLNTLLRINKISPLEVIIGEGIGKLPFENRNDEKSLKMLRRSFLNPSFVFRYFNENPFSQADITFKHLYPKTKLMGIDESGFRNELIQLRKKVEKRFESYPHIHEKGELAKADYITLELIKKECLVQEKRSLAYFNEALSYFSDYSNVAIVIGARHNSQILDYLKKNPQKDITSIFLISKRADSRTKSLINFPDDFENFKRFYNITE